VSNVVYHADIMGLPGSVAGYTVVETFVSTFASVLVGLMRLSVCGPGRTLVNPVKPSTSPTRDSPRK
jgi:hypothetical protein